MLLSSQAYYVYLMLDVVILVANGSATMRSTYYTVLQK
jgi:hypothetical protein